MKIFFLSLLLVSCAHKGNLTVYEMDQDKVKKCKIVDSENYGKWPNWKDKLILVRECE